MKKNIIIMALITMLAITGCAAKTDSANITAVVDIEQVPEDTGDEILTGIVEETEEIESAEAGTAYTYTDLDSVMHTTTLLNIRSGPSTDFEIIGVYARGEEIAMTGQCNETGWYKVNYKGTVGYCSNMYVSADVVTVEAEKAGYTYTDLDSTLYATTALNIRSGPSTDYAIIGGYARGGEIAVTGQCNETGWYRVDYKGTVGYCSNKYVSVTAVRQSTSSSPSVDELETIAVTGITRFVSVYPTDFDGRYIGRLIIPDVGVNVAVYATASDGSGQSICDAKDSAAYLWWGSTYLIGDHNTQGFDAINNCIVGTIAYIYDGNVAYKYICTGVDTNGYNDTSLMTDCDGNNIWYQNSGGITLYTCNPGNKYGSNGITIAYFQPYSCD